MKDIKDYIHLYLGCECQTPTRFYLNEKGKAQKKVGNLMEIDLVIDQVGIHFPDKPKTDLDNYAMFEVKPLLRPLEDMTEEEATEFIHLKSRSIQNNIDRTEITSIKFGETSNIIHFSYRKNSGHEVGGRTYYVNQSDPEQFQYLLSRSFDLFGLIDAGIAVNKTLVTSDGVA